MMGDDEGPRGRERRVLLQEPAEPDVLPDQLPGDVPGALTLAVTLTQLAATLGAGGTRGLWEALATLAAHDLGVARAVEPHLDAAAILHQAGLPAPVGVWGVFAAEGGSQPLRASTSRMGWVLDGVKPWCSLADRLDGALVTATDREGERGLFAVNLRDSGVQVQEGSWWARGLTEIPSGPVSFRAVRARPVGDPGWYLARPGFGWGGVGVAACWFGGAVGVARLLRESLSESTNPHALAHLGAVDSLLYASRLALLDAARRIDAGDQGDVRLLAKRVRQLVARSCEEVLERSGRALGPAPLALNREHAKRVADLQLYIRQYHAERDDESQGRMLAAAGESPW